MDRSLLGREWGSLRSLLKLRTCALSWHHVKQSPGDKVFDLVTLSSASSISESRESLGVLQMDERRKRSIRSQVNDSGTASMQENINYARLCRLLVDVGCTVLRDTFDSIHPPANLCGILSNPSVLSTLQSLRKKRVLNPLQWGKLFPVVTSTVSSANFNATVLMVLLKNSLSPPVSTGNWDQLPPDSDDSIEANIVRIKWYRDEVYAHSSEASVDDPTFNALWQTISSAVLALGSETSDSGVYKTVISELENAEGGMDPAAEAHYIKLLSDWKKDDDELKEMHEELKDSRIASGPAAFASRQENINYARLCRLLVDVGCTVLRDTFDGIHPPANLCGILSDPSVSSTLQSLRKKRVLNPLQWGKLFPVVTSTVSSANFDLTVLMVLLKNICGLSPPVSTCSWDLLPLDSDKSTEANIVRIKCYRDEVYVHTTKASVDEPTFNALWQKISSAILALGSGYGTIISRLKTECIDPAAEAHYQKLLSEWKKDDDILKKILERTHDDIGEIKEKQQKTNSELGEMKENQEITNIELGEGKGNQERASELLRKIEGNQERANDQLRKIEERVNEQLRKIKVSDPFDHVKCISMIRQLYEDREGWLAPFPWCEEFRFNLDNIFTRLKFVSRRKERGIKTDDSIDMFEIFQPHKECSQPRRVLIEGQPGMGKTTYCHKIAFNWAKERKGGKSFPDVFLVLLLKCKDINSGLWEAVDDQLLPREVNEEEKEKFFTFIRDHQSKVLLVLDGLDELPISQLSIYRDIIQGRVLPESYLVVTARHEIGVTVRECCHTLLEVEGFTKTDAKNFIRRYFKEEEDLAEKLLDKLDSDITLQDLTANPLNAALLCLLCEDFQGKLPESRTLLYLEIIECVLRRYTLKMKLPETDQDLTALYQVELRQLGRIAMEGLHNDSMYFDQSAFQGFSSNLKSGLGFLSVEIGRSKRRPGRSYGFLHKSFQEFFAALHCCCQLLDGEVSVDSLIADRRYFVDFQQVLMFTSGMLAQKNKAAVKALIAGIATQVKNNSHLHVALACINECKREEYTFCKEMAQFFGSHLQLQTADCNGFNKELAAVCIETMKTNYTVTRLHLHECNIDDATAAALHEQLKDNSTLTLLDLSHNTIGEVGADALVKGLKENSTLTWLDLSNNAIGEVGADALAKGLKVNSMLRSLLLSSNAIGEVGADALAKGLKENSTLMWLDLSNNAIGEIGAYALAKGLKENSTLAELDLSNNAIGKVGADALAKGLKEYSMLTSLKLTNNVIGEVGADALAKGLKENSRLTSLDLSNNAIGDIGAVALAKGLTENSILTELDLSYNAIGIVGAVALAKGVKKNSTLTSLELSNNAIGEVGADALAKALKENSTLTWLFLSNNAIGKVGADALAEGLKENSTLTLLNLSSNAIGDVGADALAKGLKENSTLTWLDLSNNAIGEVGADALAKGLKRNSMLTELDLSNNAIGDIGADALAKGLKENSTLTSLLLSSNAIGKVGADALAGGLKENSILTLLELSCNAVGEVGAGALAKVLKENSTLTSLDLSNNAIGNVGAGALAKGLKENSTLTEMCLSDNLIDDFVAATLKDTLKENEGLELFMD